MMQTDVMALYADAGGVLPTGPTRLKGIYIYCGSSAGSLELTELAGGDSNFKIATPAAATNNPIYIQLPGEGIRFDFGIYAIFTNIAAITVFYG